MFWLDDFEKVQCGKFANEQGYSLARVLSAFG